MRTSWIRGLGVVIIAALAAGSAAGCGGGGGKKQVVPTTCIEFQGAAAPAASTVVTRQGSGSQCEMVQVELVLTDVTDVLSVDFTVDYDAARAQYEGVSLAGSVLSSDGANVNVLEDEAAGQVSVDLFRTVTGIDFDGSGTLVRLIFSPASGAPEGMGAFSFSSTQIFGSEIVPQEKAGIQWFGGTFHTTEN